MLNIKLPKDYSLQKTGISQSLLSNLGCRQRFLFAINRWTHPEKISKTRFGSLVHQVLDDMYNFHGTVTKEKIFKCILRYQKEHEDEYGNNFDAIGVDKIKAFTLLKKYIKYYKEDFTNKKFTQIEKTFAVKYRGVILRGKRDAVFSLRGKLWLMEHKTKSRINVADLVLQLAFDLQNLFYIVTAEMESKKEFTGVLYNVIRNPGTEPKKGENAKAYERRLEDEVDKHPEHYFLRYEVPYTRQDKIQFLTELMFMLEEVESICKGKVGIYRNRSLCQAPFRCQYLNACSGGTMTGYTKKEKLFEELEDE